MEINIEQDEDRWPSTQLQLTFNGDTYLLDVQISQLFHIKFPISTLKDDNESFSVFTACVWRPQVAKKPTHFGGGGFKSSEPGELTFLLTFSPQHSAPRGHERISLFKCPRHLPWTTDLSVKQQQTENEKLRCGPVTHPSPLQTPTPPKHLHGRFCDLCALQVQIWNISQISHTEGKTADGHTWAFPPRCSENTALSPKSVSVYLVECSSSLSVLVQSQNLTEFGTSLGCPWGVALSPFASLWMNFSIVTFECLFNSVISRRGASLTLFKVCRMTVVFIHTLLSSSLKVCVVCGRQVFHLLWVPPLFCSGFCDAFKCGHVYCHPERTQLKQPAIVFIHLWVNFPLSSGWHSDFVFSCCVSSFFRHPRCDLVKSSPKRNLSTCLKRERGRAGFQPWTNRLSPREKTKRSGMKTNGFIWEMWKLKEA